MLAKFVCKMPEDFLLRLSKLGDKTDEICEKSLKAGAKVVEKNVRSTLKAAIGSGVKVPSRSTGELLASLGTSPMYINQWGDANIKIGFNEPRREQHAAKGKRSYYESTNAMIANVLEYGKSGQPPRAFLRLAKIKSRDKCEAAMIKAFNEEVKKL